MYYGEMTEELEKLYEEYDAVFQDYPCCYEELDYGQEDYDDYVADIKKAIRERKELPSVADCEESDW